MGSAPCSHLWGGSAEAEAGAMLVACRLAGLSALILDYVGGLAVAQLTAWRPLVDAVDQSVAAVMPIPALQMAPDGRFWLSAPE